MRYQFVIAVLAALVSMRVAQVDEVKLDSPQPKITTVAAMRMRKAPQITAEEIVRLKLATVVNAVARSTNQDTIGDNTDYWYRVNLPNGQTGWLFGGLLLDYTPQQRQQQLDQIIEARLKAVNTEFADRQETYDLAVSAINEANDPSTRAKFELLKLLALARWAVTFPNNLSDKSPYREWLKAHEAEVIRNEFAGGYNLRSEVLWALEAKYHKLPIADRIAWEAATNWQPSDCEGDEVCSIFALADEIKYIDVHPAGSRVAEAVEDLDEMVTDEVIKAANAKGGDKYVVEQRTELRKKLAFLRSALAKTSAPQKDELMKKLAKVNFSQ